MYQTYNARPIPQASNRPKRRLSLVLVPLAITALLIIYILYALMRPLSAPKTILTPPVTPALVKVNIPWPKSGTKEQAAYGADGYGLLAASSNTEVPTPTASVTKVITALTVLQKKPLQSGEQGPLITLTQADVDIYNKYVAMDGSAVPVSAGQTISEYRAIEALLLPSANNIADTLAIWAFGSLPAYTNSANAYVKSLNMSSTNVADASGFSPSTVSTASDLIRLGDAALDNPVITQIAGERTAVFPGYGTMQSTNKLLGQAGINGLKTGNTDEAGGCFLGTADVVVGGETIKVITAVMAAPDLSSALRDTVPLVQSSQSQFQDIHVVRANQTIGSVTTKWGERADIVSDKPIDLVSWTGSSPPALTTKSNFAYPATAGAKVGTASLDYHGKTYSTDLKLKSAIEKPGVWWRLSHPY